jgi:hypothetical protein
VHARAAGKIVAGLVVALESEGAKGEKIEIVKIFDR